MDQENMELSKIAKKFRSLLRFEVPVVEYVISTELSEEETIERLNLIIQERTQTFPEWVSDDNSPYFGTIEDGRFSAYKLSYRDSFNPQIEGKVGAQSGQTNVTLAMSVEGATIAFIKVFGRVWVLALLIYAIGSAWKGMFTWTLLSLIMILFPYLFYRIGVNSFFREAQKRFVELESALTE